MAALTGPRNTPYLGEIIGVMEVAVKANAVLFKGALVMADSATGYLVPGSAQTGARAAGMVDTESQPSIDATGLASGDVKAKVLVGVFPWDNSTSGDLIGQTELFKDCYIVDDHTVAKTDGSSSRSVAGKVIGFTPGGKVYVRTGPL